jgi:hypothetical protein
MVYLNFGQTIWEKPMCYWEHIENLRTLWNLMRTHWEQGKKYKKSLSPPSLPLSKREKLDRSCMHAEPSGCMKFLFPILFITKFFVWANTPS